MGYWCDISSSILSFGKNQSPFRTHLNLLSNFLYLHPAQLTLNHELWLLSYLSPHTFTNSHLHSQLHSSAHTFTLKQTSHSLSHSDSNTHRQNIHTLKDSDKVPTLIKCDNQNGKTAEGRNSLIRKCSKRLKFFFWAVWCDASGNYPPPLIPPSSSSQCRTFPVPSMEAFFAYFESYAYLSRNMSPGGAAVPDSHWPSTDLLMSISFRLKWNVFVLEANLIDLEC